MIYIKRINGDVVQLGGQVATEAMLEDGWFEYDGVVPQGTDFRLVDGVLESFVPEKPELEQYYDYKKYLSDTDHKMYADYEPKPGEDLEAIKAQRKIAREFARTHEASRVVPGGDPKIAEELSRNDPNSGIV